MKPKILLTLIFIISVIFCFGATEKVSLRVVGKNIYQAKLANNQTKGSYKFQLSDNKTPFELNDEYWVNNSVARIKFGIDNYYSKNNYTNPIKYSISLKNIKLRDKQNQLTIIQSKVFDFEIKLDEKIEDIIILTFENCNSIEFEIESVTEISKAVPTTSNYFSVQENVFMDIEIETERYYYLNQDLGNIKFTKNVDNVLKPTELDLFWNYIVGAEEYQLEWTFVSSLEHNSSINFANNSTRVSTRNQSYKIPLIYGIGRIYYRLRAVGKVFQSNSDFFSEWSEKGYFDILYDFEPMKNWIYNIKYAEDGLKKENISFFDGSLRERQSQSKNNSNNDIITSEIIYDRLGRPSVNVLPTPTSNSNFGYIENLNINESNIKYSWADFDNASVTNALKMSNNSGASKYFSMNNVNNTSDYTPNAQNYPFSQTIYTADHTGRIASQNLPGEKFIDNENKTRIYYGRPSQNDLYKMFGSQAGLNHSYSQKMIVDPDGVTTLEYYNSNNQIVASNVIGSRKDNLMSLEGDCILENEQLVNTFGGSYIVENNHAVIDDKLLFTQLINVPIVTDFSINYNFNAAEASFCANQICFNCYYTLKIIFKNVETGEVRFSDDQILLGAPEEYSCAPFNYISSGATIANLPPGQYELIKELSVRKDKLDEYADYYIDKATAKGCILNLDNFNNFPNINLCEYSKEDCIEILGSTHSQHQELYPYSFLSFQDYNEAIEACGEGRQKNLTPSKSLLANMLLDMKPGGQYGGYQERYHRNGEVEYFSNDYTSIYGITDGNFENYAGGDIQLYNWRNPKNMSGISIKDKYYDDDELLDISIIPVINGYPQTLSGNVHSNTDGTTYCYPNELLYLTDFITNWKPSWAYSLVAYHPEFTYYQWSKDYLDYTFNQENSEQFDARLRSYTTFSQALAKFPELININSTQDLFDYDPLFNKVSSSDIFEIAFLDKLQNYKSYTNNNSLSYLPLKTLMIISAKYGQYACESFNIAEVLPTAIDVRTYLIDEESRNLFWRLYRDLYLLEKSKTIEHLANKFAVDYYDSPSNPNNFVRGYNKCLGSEFFNIFEYGFHKTLNSTGDNQWLNDKQPCSINMHYYFKDKIRRFAPYSGNLTASQTATNPEIYTNSLENISSEALLRTTGQCKEAVILETFINDLIQKNHLFSTTNLNNNYVFMQNMFSVIYPGRDCNNTVEWEGSILNNSLIGNITTIDNTNRDNLTQELFTLYLPPNYLPQLSINNIVRIKNLIFTKKTSDGKYNFKCNAIINNDSNEEERQLSLYGKTIYRIDECYEGVFTELVSTEVMHEIVDIFNLAANTTDGLSNPNFSLPYSSQNINRIIRLIQSAYFGDRDKLLFLGNNRDIDGLNIPDEFLFLLTSHVDQLGVYLVIKGLTSLQNITYFDAQQPVWDEISQSFTMDAYTSTNPNQAIKVTCSIFPIWVIPDRYGNYLYPGQYLTPNKALPIGGEAKITPQECKKPEFLNIGLKDWLNKCLQSNLFYYNSISPLPDLKFLSDYYLASNTVIYPFKEETLKVFSFTVPEDPIYPLQPDPEIIYFFQKQNVWNTAHMASSPPGFITSSNYINSQYNGDIVKTLTKAMNNTDYELKCGINFQTPDNSTINFSKIISFLDIQPIIPSSDAEYTYDFTAKVLYLEDQDAYGYPDLEHRHFKTIELIGSSCIPLKICHTCKRSTPKSFDDCESAYLNYNTATNNNPELIVDKFDYCFQDYYYWQTYYLDYVNYFGFSSMLHPSADKYFISFNKFCANQMGKSVGDYLNFINRLTALLQVDKYNLGEYHITLQQFASSGMQACYQNYLIALKKFLNSTPSTKSELRFPSLNIWLLNQQCADNVDPFPYPCPGPPYHPIEFPNIQIPDVACGNFLDGLNANNALVAYNNYIAIIKKNFKSNYLQRCINAHENLNITKTNCNNVTTLYYYDRAGNLTKTVPPEGFLPISSEEIPNVREAITNNSDYLPNHLMLTYYNYDSRNLVTSNTTPDEGTTKFYYDDAARLRFSQDQKQRAKSINKYVYYSYTKYDQINRPVESGESWQSGPSGELFPSNYFIRMVLNDNSFPNLKRTQITNTFWDTHSDATLFTNGQQTNLRSRIAAVKNFADDDAIFNNKFTYATHYTYDIHGNVKELVQQNGLLQAPLQKAKNILYDYDLISGNVKLVSYQPNQPDQFYHKYRYDADNRITQVFTSSDKVIWDEDASYFYYRHGPLARTEIGELKVQGIDYVYTLQGWLKGVNSNTLMPYRDPGKDGDIFTSTTINWHKNVARDAFGYSLGYYLGDYQAINPTPYSSAYNAGPINPSDIQNLQFEAPITGTNIEASRRDLLSGNISHMVTTLPDLKNYSANYTIFASPLATAYKYDILNRLTQMKAFDLIDLGGNEWRSGDGSGGQSVEKMFEMNIAYSKNGNIKHLSRNSMVESNLTIDDLTYGYTRYNNQLRTVRDNITNTPIGNDFAGLHNYTCDEIGNLISDPAEEIETIEWNLQGKVTKISRIAGSEKPNLEFAYDPMGNRILKIVKPRNKQETWQYTWYVRDAHGNTMATYNMNYAPIDGTKQFFEYLNLTAHDLYGSSRLGVKENNLLLNKGIIEISEYKPDGSFGAYTTISNERPEFNNGSILHTLGYKQYELTNHLGNVLLTVSDNRRAIADPNNSLLVSHYEPYISTINDYYPFGMPMAERSYQSEKYRFGFNGQEKVDEVSGFGNHNTAEFWEYDTRIGRRWNIDPITYPWQSPYACFNNNPICFLDPLGLEGDDPPVNANNPIQLSEVTITANRTVVVDPGHGLDGTTNPQVDPGAVGNGFNEKDIVLNISNSVNTYLAQWNANTVMTRTGDLTVNQEQISYRLNVANNNSAEIFLSIHTNSVLDNTKNGFIVCYNPNNTNGTNSQSLAEEIIGAQSTMPLFGTGYQKRTNLGVLNQFTGSASVLVEVGFISNSGDVKLMTTNSDQIGREIALGVYRYMHNAEPPEQTQQEQGPAFIYQMLEMTRDNTNLNNNSMGGW